MIKGCNNIHALLGLLHITAQMQQKKDKRTDEKIGNLKDLKFLNPNSAIFIPSMIVIA
jgi:hypothetical protein